MQNNLWPKRYQTLLFIFPTKGHEIWINASWPLDIYQYRDTENQLNKLTPLKHSDITQDVKGGVKLQRTVILFLWLYRVYCNGELVCLEVS